MHRLVLGRLLTGGVAAAMLAATAAAPAAAAQRATATHTHTTARTGAHLAGPHRLRPRGHNPAIITGPMIYHGGTVQTAPRVYVDFWDWTSDPSGEQPYLEKFLASVGGTPWLATVGQYGAGSGGDLLAGTWSDPSAIPASPNDAQIQAEAVNAINHFGTGTSANVEIVVATPTGHSTPGFGTSFCAYHGKVSADPNVTYTDLPYMTDAGSTCGEDLVNGSGGTLDGVSIVEGHELAESITDPLLNAWYDSGGNEIGDKCAWTDLANITTSNGKFAVQPLWSNAAGGCELAAGGGSGTSYLTANQTLQSGQSLAEGILGLTMGTDGNLVMTDQGHAVWANGKTGYPGARLAMQGDGNLVEYTTSNVAVWSSGTYGDLGAYASLTGAGGFGVTNGSSRLWGTALPNTTFRDTASSTPDVLFAGQSLGAPGFEMLDRNSGYSLYEYEGWLEEYQNGTQNLLWYSGSYCSGSSATDMQSDGNLVTYCNGKATWSSGTGGHQPSNGIYLHLQTDGNVVLYTNYGTFVWANGV